MTILIDSGACSSHVTKKPVNSNEAMETKHKRIYSCTDLEIQNSNLITSSQHIE